MIKDAVDFDYKYREDGGIDFVATLPDGHSYRVATCRVDLALSQYTVCDSYSGHEDTLSTLSEVLDWLKSRAKSFVLASKTELLSDYEELK